MAIDTSPLDQIAAMLEGMTTTDLESIERAGLRAVGAYVKPALVAVTPVSPGPFGSTSLPKGALKAAVRTKVVKGEGDRGPASVTGFGKLSIFAERVDSGTSEAGANPFVRRLQDAPAFQEKAQEAFVAGAQAKVEELLRGK